MRAAEPVLVLDLFPEERELLLVQLERLSLDEWGASTACPGWSVKDVAAHLLGDDLGRLSRGRDRFTGWQPSPDESLLAFVNRQNSEWVQGMRRVSSAVLLELLHWSGVETVAYFRSLAPFEIGPVVSWAGPEPGPVWLDLAREYTERWHHQQHIREAIGAPVLTESRFFAPVLATFARALPHTFRATTAPTGAAVQLTITGPSGGDWTIVREGASWQLYQVSVETPSARVTLDQECCLATLHPRADGCRSRYQRLDRGESAIRRDSAGNSSHYRLMIPSTRTEQISARPIGQPCSRRPYRRGD